MKTAARPPQRALRFWHAGEALLRRLRFNARAALISLVFSVPIAALAFVQVSESLRTLSILQEERTGLAAVVLAVDVLRAVGDERANLVPIANARAAAVLGKPRPAGYAEARAHLVRYIADQPSLGALKEAVDLLPPTLPSSPGSAEPDQATEAFELQTQVATDTLNVVSRLIEVSRLDQDSDALGQLLVKGILQTLPVLMEKSRQVSVLGGLAVDARAVDEFQRRMLADQIPVIEFLDGVLDDAVRKAGALSEPLKLGLNPDDASGRTAELRGLARALVTADEIRVPVDTLANNVDRVLGKLDALQARGQAELARHFMARDAALKQRQLSVLSVIGASLMLAAYLFVSFGRVTKGGMALLATHMERMRGGDLAPIPRSSHRDEVADLLEDLRNLQESLAAIVSEVRHATGDVYFASDSVSADAASLLGRTQQSAAWILDAADAASELEAGFRVNLDSVHAVEGLSKGNSDAAQEAQSEIAMWLSVMGDLQQSSGRIHDITDFINEIAFRTNLLALNAAVEAAKAGVSGRGFAVIAGDVRQLSKRTAQAAQEIQRMLTDNKAKVSMCAAMGARAHARMAGVVENASGIGQQLTQVAVDSHQRMDAVARMSVLLHELRALMQASAAEVERTRGSVQGLLACAASLEARVEVFRVAEAAD